MLSWGGLSDRIGMRNSLVIVFVLTVIGLALLAWGGSTAVMWVAVAVFGLGMGGEMPLVPALVGERYGKERLSTMTGAIFVFALVGTAGGPYFGGAIFDWAGSYFWALAGSAAMVTGSLSITLRLGPAPQGLERQR